MSYFMTSDNVRLNYTLRGAYGAPTLVFSSGYSGNQGTWAVQVPYFVAMGYRVLTWDYRNHGDSQTVDFGLTVARFATDLQELLTTLRLENVVLIGHSMGAMVTYAYLALQPVNVLAVVTEDQPPQALSDENWPYGRKAMRADNLAAVAEQFPQATLIAKPIASDVKRLIGKNAKPFDYVKTMPVLQDALQRSYLAVLQHEKVPHLFLAGSESPLYDAKQATASRKLQAIDASAAYIFSGCGHIPHLEMPTTYNQVVADFLTKIQVMPVINQ